jgi:hypothetical protein
VFTLQRTMTEREQKHGEAVASSSTVAPAIAAATVSAGSSRTVAEAREVLGSTIISNGIVSGSDAISSSPSSFFSSSLSSSDSAFHRVAVLLCPGCTYLEFPGCLIHSGLLCNIKGQTVHSTRNYVCTQVADSRFALCCLAITGNGYMSCTACELDRKAKGGADMPGSAENLMSSVCATDSAEPWSVACQGCNKVKADTIVSHISKNTECS